MLKSTAGSHVRLGAECRPRIGTPPLHHEFGLRDRRPDYCGRGLDPAHDGHARQALVHRSPSSSTSATSLSMLTVQRLSYRLSHAIASRIGPTERLTDTMRPVLIRVISPASDRTSRCFIIPGSFSENGRASSLTESPGFSFSRSRTARRVGSASAENVRSIRDA